MKKIFVILIVLCLTFSAYADIVLFDVGGGYHAGITPLEKSTTAISSVSLGATARLMFLDGVGLYLHGNIAFPQSIQSFADGNSVSTKPGYDVFLGYDTLIGVALMPVKTNSFGLLLAPGVHIGGLYMSETNSSGDSFRYKSSKTEANFGVGIDISCELYFTKNVYGRLGVLAAWDFYSYQEVEEELNTVFGEKDWEKNNTGNTNTFVIQPTVAIGFRL